MRHQVGENATYGGRGGTDKDAGSCENYGQTGNVFQNQQNDTGTVELTRKDCDKQLLQLRRNFALAAVRAHKRRLWAVWTRTKKPISTNNPGMLLIIMVVPFLEYN